MTQSQFAAFVMTYERPEVLQQTLQVLLDQTYPPEIILIVDNSEDDKTERMIEALSLPKLVHYRVGYNSGPAGAACIGLNKLMKMGYQWIYWGDDDNPPRNRYEFEQLFNKIPHLLEKEARLGVIGGKGGMFNRFTGRVRSLSNFQLKKDTFVEVDSVPGGHTLLVNAQVVKEGCLPDKNLFFGFEELDFSFKVKEKAFKLFVDAETWLRIRAEAKNVHPGFRPRASGFGNIANLKREYYSSRNLLYIFYRHHYFFAFGFHLGKIILKSFLGFKFGTPYGYKNLRIQWKAIVDFFMGQEGPLAPEYSNTT